MSSEEESQQQQTSICAEPLPPRRTTHSTNPLCLRCATPTPSITVFRVADPLCSTHFTELLLKRFKNMMNKTREENAVGSNVRKGKKEMDKILVAFSGGLSSRVMLHMINECVGNAKRKKMFFDVEVVHIDESALNEFCSAPLIPSEENIHKIVSIVESYSLPFHLVKLEDIFHDEDPAKRAELLKNAFRDATTLTASEDFLAHLRFQLLRLTAMRLGFGKVLIGTSANRMAMFVISSTSRGRGGIALPIETSFSSSIRYFPITFYQPMRDFLTKEIALYGRCFSLESVFIPNINTMAPPKASINVLTENFIETLQSEFPHTIHTLLKSAEKIQIPEEIAPFMNCPVCFIPLTSEEKKNIQGVCCDRNNNSHKSNNSNNNNKKNNSGVCSSEGCESNSSNSGCCGGSVCGDSNSSNNNNSFNSRESTQISELKEFLCFGCKTLLKDFSRDSVAPPFVIDQTKKLCTSQQLRDQIKDFILDDEDDEDEGELQVLR